MTKLSTKYDYPESEFPAPWCTHNSTPPFYGHLPTVFSPYKKHISAVPSWFPCFGTPLPPMMLIALQGYAIQRHTRNQTPTAIKYTAALMAMPEQVCAEMVELAGTQWGCSQSALIVINSVHTNQIQYRSRLILTTENVTGHVRTLAFFAIHIDTFLWLRTAFIAIVSLLSIKLYMVAGPVCLYQSCVIVSMNTLLQYQIICFFQLLNIQHQLLNYIAMYFFNNKYKYVTIDWTWNVFTKDMHWNHKSSACGKMSYSTIESTEWIIFEWLIFTYFCHSQSLQSVNVILA